MPRERALTIGERIDADGQVVSELDESSVDGLVASLDRESVDSVAIGLLHSYANPAHEERLAALIGERRPNLTLSLSSRVCPEIREYDRLCTTVANAYIKPLMARYLTGAGRGACGRGV